MVELKDNTTSYVEIRYYTKCGNPLGNLNKTNTCEGFKVLSNNIFIVY